MTDAPEHTRLNTAITWTGVGAATALAAMLMMLAFAGFDSAVPGPGDSGAGRTSAVGGAFWLFFSLAVSVPSGRTLARGYRGASKVILLAIPVVVSVIWALLYQTLQYVGLMLVFGLSAAWVPLQQLMLLAALSAGALPICLALFAAFLVLVKRRAGRRPSPASDAVQQAQEAARPQP